MKTELKQNEQIIKEAAANLQKGLESVGGKLYLTNQRLVFEAHKVNIQGGNTVINLFEIQSTAKCWTNFLGFIPLIPNSLCIQTKTGKEFRFVVSGRSAWATAIDANKNV